LNAEVAVGKLALGAGFRWLSPGLVARALFLNDENEFGFSYGIAGRAQYFFREPLVGPHMGVALELLRSRVENEPEQIATLSTYVIPQLEGGYRFDLDGLFVGMAFGAGYAARAASSVENLPGGNNAHLYKVLDESSLYGVIRLDVGVFF
jgi:hypothetical protein